ncbi:MAG: tetratricopeptide repeat protein [Phycisphaerales bacterium]
MDGEPVTSGVGGGGGAWPRMWEVFHGAVEREGESRAAYVAAECGADGGLRARVERLLAAHRRAGTGGLLEPAARPSAFAFGGADGQPPGEGGGGPTRIGNYVIRERIGEGGFAEVFLATQTEPVRRDVAVKLLRSGVGAGRVIERFDAERQTLAVLHHPNIATIFDAGVTENGRPYFVMEHIAGRPITRYCDERRLDLRARLGLFMDVCRAVQHAHHKGVIHRDLKPSNVMVTEVDGKPVVKVIDFGIARAIDRAAGPGDAETLAGTPGYMSPEQAETGDVDTRTDVFSLGVMLYELLTGAPPFDTPGPAAVSATLEHARITRLKDAPPPSARALTTPPDAARRRRLEPRALARRLRGDLDAIALRSLARDRALRYASPAELAADLDRWARHRPVSAGPSSWRYRAGKFARRHRVGVGVALAAVAVVVAGVAQLAVTARTEQRLRSEAVGAKDLALRDARLSEQAALFLRQEILAAAAARPGTAAALLEVIESAEARIGERYKDDPLAEAGVRRTLGDVYAMLKRNDRALSNAHRAVELLTRHLGEDDRHTFQAINNLGIAYRQAGRPADAVPLHERSLEFWRRVNGPEARETLAQAVNLGGLLSDLGRFSEAEPVLREALATAERVYGAGDGLPTLAGFFHAAALQGLERWEEAEVRFRAVYEQQRPLGEDHVRTIATRARLAAVLSESGRAAEAEPMFRGVIESNVRRVGPDHLDTLSVQAGLARCLANLGRFEEAEPLILKALERHRSELGREHARVLALLNAAGDLYLSWNRAAEAEGYLREAADGARATLAETHAARGKYLLNHGRCLLELGRFAEAEERLLEALRIIDKTFGPNHPRSAAAIEALATVCERTNRPEEAAAYRARLKVGHKTPP